MLISQSTHSPWLAGKPKAFYMCDPDEPWLTPEIVVPYRYSRNLSRPPFKPSDLDGLVPLDFTDSDGLDPRQLDIIEPAIAHIVLQGFCWINWSFLYYESGIDDQTFVAFRQKLFKTLTKLVLTLYDIYDFQRCLDETNIVKSNQAFLDHLKKSYGVTPESFSKAMDEISHVDFNQFPFLSDEDICFTLERYQMDCSRVSLRQRPSHVMCWPSGSSLIEAPCVVFGHHLKLVREVLDLDEYLPLTEDEKMELLLEMDQDPLTVKKCCAPAERKLQRFGPLMRALSLEPWNDIQPVDLDVFNVPKSSIFERDVYFPRHLFRLIDDLVLTKAAQVHTSMINVTYPLRCGVWGSFTDEVQKFFRGAYLNRRRLGHRFLNADHILSEIYCTRIGFEVDVLILRYRQTPIYCSKEYNNKYVVIDICRWAGYVAKILVSDDIKLEHIVLAFVFGKGLLDWNAIVKQGFVVEFLKRCNEYHASGSSPEEQSPDKKKMKLSEDAIDSILFDTERVLEYEYDIEREGWDHMKFLCEELKNYGGMPRKKILDLYSSRLVCV